MHEIDQEQAGAIKRSAKLGRTLQTELGDDLASFFRRGGTYRAAVARFDIESRYGVTYSVAWNGVRLAISGHNGICKVEEYSGLLDLDERQSLSLEHKQTHGNYMLENRIGIHGLSPEERSKNGVVGGRKGGSACFEKRVGIHNLSEAENLEIRRLATLGRKQIPWSDQEMSEAYDLSQQLAYRINDRLKGKKLAHDLNAKYNNGRSSESVQMAIRRYNHNLKKEKK